MDSKEEIENQMYEKLKLELYKTKGYIDFSKINDDDSQAKLALFLMEVAEWGSKKIIRQGPLIITMLENQIKSLGNSKEEREEIEEINSDIQNIHKAISSCEEAVEKIETERNKIKKKFWTEEWEARERGISMIPEWENIKREFDSSEQNMQKLRSGQELSLEETREKLLLARRFEDPEDYSPFNDPDNKYGWKEFCITRRKLYAHSLEKFLKEKKTMQVTDDKQDTPPRSGDETSTSHERNGVKIGFSNMELAILTLFEKQMFPHHADDDDTAPLSFPQEKKVETLGTPMEVTDDKQDTPPCSGDETSTSHERNSVKIRLSKKEVSLLRSFVKKMFPPHADDDGTALLSFPQEKKIETLGTPMEVTDDKQDTPPSSGDETSTSHERNSVEIGISKKQMAILRSFEKEMFPPHADDDGTAPLSFPQEKKIEILGTPMEVTDDKQDTPPRSGDRGIESKENSLSPLNSSNESKGSSVPKDSGISSDETSTSPERKGVKIDYSKVKKTLERIMGTDPYLDSIHPQRIVFKRQCPIMGNWSDDYEVLVERALLDFCERHLQQPPDDYLLLGLGYVKFKQSNVVLTN